ncbi:MAG TPA: Imm50 family immunity protein [Pyrinomonadaceae bacterium]
MKWHRLTLNPQSLENLYNIVPELESVDLFSINLNRESPSLEMSFDLPQFPDNPSPRWNEKCNTVQIKLIFWGVADFEAKGWHRNMKVKIDMEKNEKALKVLIFNSEIDLMFSFSCNFVLVKNISAYINAIK